MAAKKIYNVLKEIQLNLNMVIFFNAFLSALIAYLFFYLILSLFNFFEILAIIPALMYFIILIYIRTSRSKPRIIESRYDKLREKLRTALDYRGIENPVVNELQQEVIDDMRHVSLSSFFSRKKTTLKILAIVLLCFMILAISISNKVIFDIGNVYKKFSEKPDLPVFEAIIEESELLGNMFGDPSTAKLGDKELKIEIKTSSFEVDVRQIGETPQQEFEETFPREVFMAGSEISEENIAVEDQELVKNYFKLLYGKK